MLIGSAGTGKTESVKDLAKVVGKMCIAFNASEGVDHKTVANLLTGVVQVVNHSQLMTLLTDVAVGCLVLL